MLVHDDCFNYLKQIKNKSIDLILVDFPFLYKMKENINEYFL